MVRCRRDGIGAFRNHSGSRNVTDDLGTRQMSADTGLCTLPHLDFDGGSGFEVLLMHAETAACNLHDRVRTVAVEILMQTALTGVIENAELGSRARERRVRVITNGAVAHCREHNRHRKRYLRRQIAYQPAVCVAFHFLRLLAERNAGLHRFAERIDRRVRNLRSIDQDAVPVNRERLRVTHGGEQHAAASRLFINLTNRIVLPVCVLAELTVAFHNLKGARRTQGDAALAVDTFAFVTDHAAGVGVKRMNFIGALSFANAAGDTAVRIPHNFKFRIDKIDSHQNAPSFTVTITGSPPAGAQIFSTSGSMTRIAASSLAM